MNKKQLQEEYPVGSMVKLARRTERYGIVVGHSKNPISDLIYGDPWDVMVHETDGKVRRWEYGVLKVVGKTIKKDERQ